MKRFIDLPSGRYATWRQGSGPLVVLLHGWPVTSHHWRYLIPDLVKAGFTGLAIDLKGLGDSTAKDSRFDKPTLAREIVEVIRQVCPDKHRFTLIGHDWGGSVAIAIAALFRKNVAALIIEEEIAPGLETALSEESRRYYPTWHGGFHRTHGLAEDLILGRPVVYLDYFLNLRFRPGSLSPADRRRYRRRYRGANATHHALAYYRTRAIDVPFYRRLEKRPLTLPVLAIGGRRGMGKAVENSLRRIAPKLSGVFLRASGHYPAEEEFIRFNRQVLKWLTPLAQTSPKRPHHGEVCLRLR